MTGRIVTLFGEEEIPEQIKGIGKSRKVKAETAAALLSEEHAVPVEAPEQDPAPEPKNFELPDGWQGDKRYYPIGEVAALFQVKTSHIRFWTNEFKLKVRTTRKGDRLYTSEQIRELKTIYHLVKERGFTLSGAKARMKAPNSIEMETVDLKQSLLQLRNKLVIIRNQIPQNP